MGIRKNIKDKIQRLFGLKKAQNILFLPFRLQLFPLQTTTSHSLFPVKFLHDTWFLRKNNYIKIRSLSTSCEKSENDSKHMELNPIDIKNMQQTNYPILVGTMADENADGGLFKWNLQWVDSFYVTKDYLKLYYDERLHYLLFEKGNEL